MDFVVVGLGLGALGVLLGVLLFGVLAPLRERVADRAAPDLAARDLAIAAEQREIGRAALAAGVAVLVATSAALAAGLDDRTGAFLVTSTVTIAAIGVLYWMSLYRRRRPPPARPRRARPVAGATRPNDTGKREDEPRPGNGLLPDLAFLGIGQDGLTDRASDEVDTASFNESDQEAHEHFALSELETTERDIYQAVAPASVHAPAIEMRASQNGANVAEGDAATVVAIGPPSEHIAKANGAASEADHEENEPEGR